MTRLDYRYDECGLDNVILVGLETCVDDEGSEVITIHHINVLHRAITEAIANKPSGLTGKEVRFVRTEMGLTQAELGMRLNKDAQTIARWEKGQTPLDPTADTVLRMLVLEHVQGKLPTMKELASWATSSSAEPPILIDATDQEHWRTLEAA